MVDCFIIGSPNRNWMQLWCRPYLKSPTDFEELQHFISCLPLRCISITEPWNSTQVSQSQVRLQGTCQYADSSLTFVCWTRTRGKEPGLSQACIRLFTRVFVYMPAFREQWHQCWNQVAPLYMESMHGSTSKLLFTDHDCQWEEKAEPLILTKFPINQYLGVISVQDRRTINPFLAGAHQNKYVSCVNRSRLLIKHQRKGICCVSLV